MGLVALLAGIRLFHSPPMPLGLSLGLWAGGMALGFGLIQTAYNRALATVTRLQTLLGITLMPDCDCDPELQLSRVGTRVQEVYDLEPLAYPRPRGRG